MARHFVSQSEINRRLHVFASSCDWFNGLSLTFVIVQSDYVGFGLTTLNFKTPFFTRQVRTSIKFSSRTSVYRLFKYSGPDLPIPAALTGWPVRIKERTVENW